MKRQFNHFLFHSGAIFFLAVFLNVFGILFLATLSAPASLRQFDSTNYYLLHQILFCLLPALVLGFIAFKTPLHIIKKIAPWLFFFNILSLAFFFFPFLVFLGLISTILILQPDVSTLGVISLTLVVIYFSAKTPIWHAIAVISGGMGAILLLIKFEPYRLDRLLIFLHPESDPLGKGWQIKQSMIALGSGGFFGKGLGMSSQKFGHLPAAMTDSIFAILGEELGIIGSVGLIILFFLFFWLGLKIAKSANDRFSKLTAIGVTTWITLQAFINMASAIGIFPLAGIPLPFFSYGGSHIVTKLIGIGLLLNIYKNS